MPAFMGDKYSTLGGRELGQWTKIVHGMITGNSWPIVASCA